jgi:predicted dehydrogenase
LDQGTGKKVRVGIIGAENSHTVSFGKIFNQEKRFPGVEVVAVWGETEEFAQTAAQKGSIPRIVQDQLELLDLVDAVIIDHRHPKYHAAAAIPFLEAGIPTFIDKPFTYRSQEARNILDLAEKKGTPITCLSSIGFGPGVEDMKKQLENLGDISSIIITGPADISSKYGGIFFYGIHMLERLFKLFGDDIESVRATRHGPITTFQYKFRTGHLATAILADSWRVYCLVEDQLQEIRPRFESDDSLWMYSAIVRMFQTGQEPRSHESILRTVTTLEAMERSVSSETWEFPIH